VAGCDPGTSSLDVLVLEDGAVAAQRRFEPDEAQADPTAPVRWLEEQAPLALVAGPSGYGLPLAGGRACGEEEFRLLTLVREEERGSRVGVAGFSALVRAFARSSLPVVFLPGVIHLPTVPTHRKVGRIDLGTPDKLCVAALALAQRGQPPGRYSGCIVELGSVFTACLVLHEGRIVDGLGGTSGPPGWGSGGAWDGEAAYWLSPLTKSDLFRGGARDLPDPEQRLALLCEGVVQAVAGLCAITPFAEVVLAGRLLQSQPAVVSALETELSRLAPVVRLDCLPGAWAKHAAQGAALLADGLAGGSSAYLIDCLELRRATGSVLDHLLHSRADRTRSVTTSSNSG